MPNFKYRSHRKELMDDLSLSNEALRKNLDELEAINYWLGGNRVVIQALEYLHCRGYLPNNQLIKIADLGTGGGDVLRAVARWSRKKCLQVSLTGIDANAFMIAYAKEKSRQFTEIQFVQQNIFEADFADHSYDLIICSLLCHHFTDEELVRLFTQLKKQTSIALIINDLQRHPWAYYGILWLTRLFRCSYLAKHDAPLSVLRAFRRTELVTLLQQAGWSGLRVKWLWAFRFQVIGFPK